MKKKIILMCEECHSSNYSFPKREGSTERIVIKKYCKKCMKHTIHKETR